MLAATNISLMVSAVDERDDAACFLLPLLWLLSWVFFITIFLVAFISLLYK